MSRELTGNCFECAGNGRTAPAVVLVDGTPSCAACAANDSEQWVHCTGVASACACWCCRRDRAKAARSRVEDEYSYREACQIRPAAVRP